MRIGRTMVALLALAMLAGPVLAVSPPRHTIDLSVTVPEATATGVGGAQLGLALADSIDPFVAAIGLTGQSGALVFEVERNGPAARAGFLPGDLIVAVAGTRVRNAEQLEWMLRDFDSDPLEAEVIRIGTGPDDLLAALHSAAGRGNRDAMLALGDASLFNLDGQREFGAAEEYYLRAYSLGDARAAYRLGSMYMTGKGVDIDYAVATRWYRLAAEAGLPAGQHALALTWWNGRYWTGQALVTDHAEAVRLFELAAAQGHAPSTLYLGLAHEFGYGTTVDYAKAGEWYDRSIASGSTEAMVRRAAMAEAGQGGPANPRQALALLKSAAALGSVEANRQLGRKYREGDGVAQHPLRAMEYYRAAAEQGDAPAMSAMAEILLSGYGVTRDPQAAMDWYFRAYQAGDADAGFALALAHADGVGVRQDRGKVAGYMLGAIRGGSNAALEEMRSNADGWEIEVREDLQRLLQASGFYQGEIDGVFGPGTQRALEAAASAG
ncbi:MAG TPA: PDZ domain-containing protein [Devosiaceae bacterium]|jgi:hypothetical protein|nr:PDZ domain-containing protein [Devosiaceae bacterium]